MKKICMLLAVLLAVSLCACGAQESTHSEQAIVRAPKETEPAAASETEAAEVPETAIAPFAFEGHVLQMGAALDISALPEPASVYEAPSCAIEGTDLVYTYEHFELSAFDDGTGPVIRSVYFMSPDIATAEGLALGDGLNRVLELYGENYEQNGSAYCYRWESTVLSILVQNDAVIGIEYQQLTPEQNG